MVEESDGAVEVCITVLSPNISCPITFPFEFNIHATNGTAGILQIVPFGNNINVMFSLPSVWCRL